MVEKDIPKFHETFLNILEVLSDGQTIHSNSLRKKVRDNYYYDLTQEALSQKTKNGDLLILNRIGWGISYLNQAKLVHRPQRGMVQITEKGLKVFKIGSLSLKDLKRDADYIEYERVKKEEKNKSQNGEMSGSQNVDNETIDNSSPQDLIDRGFTLIEDETKKELLDKFKRLDPYYFEKVILILLEKMGYGDFIETKKSGDGGIDGIINQDQLGLEKIFIQAKRYSENKVREKDIRNFIGAMSGDTSKGVFVTTSEFDESAIQKAKDAHHTIVLIDGQKLSSLMYQYGVGVQTKNVYEVKEVDEDFFDAE